VKSWRTLAFVAAASCLPLFASAGTTLDSAVAADDLEAIKAMGPSVLPRLARLYALGDEEHRQHVATVFYRLGWKSEEAKDALMKDVHTANQGLRVSVQYALGRVSSDVSVVDVLLDNMQNDAQILFRDKAACALAYDQVHLTPAQKVHLYEGLIRALDDPKLDVRRIAVTVLQIQTGQDKGFRFAGPPEARARAVEAWRQWLAEYRSQL
jgi:HEAT repeat protein